MLRIMYKSKIQKATITHVQMDYEGSIGIDSDLMEMADIVPNEGVQVLNLDTGARFQTYAIKERKGSGKICLYGPAVHLGKPGERVFIISYCLVDKTELLQLKPKVIYVDENNKIKAKAEKNG